MTDWLLLIFAAGLAAMAALTAVRAPTLFLWKVALLAGEYGHWLAVLPVALLGLAWARGGEFAGAVIGLCGVAAGLLLRPAVQGAWIGRGLPVKLAGALGEGGAAMAGRRAFSWRGLMRRGGARVAVEAHEAGPGLPMDFYRAAGAMAAAPCVIVVHGGGWDGGDRTQLPAMNHHLARQGYAVAAVSYGLAPARVWPSQADDIGAALGYLKTNAVKLGIDPTRFVLLGRSAGGQLATAVAYGKTDTAVRGVVSLYGPQDQVFAWRYSREDDLLKAAKLLRQFLGGSPETAAEAYRSASAYLIATKDNAVPTLLVHGANDPLVWHRQSERLHAKLDGLGVPNVFVSLPWATHAADFNLHGPSGQLTVFAIEWFLAAVTR